MGGFRPTARVAQVTQVTRSPERYTNLFSMEGSPCSASENVLTQPTMPGVLPPSVAVPGSATPLPQVKGPVPVPVTRVLRPEPVVQVRADHPNLSQPTVVLIP